MRPMKQSTGGGGSLGWSLDAVYTSSAFKKITFLCGLVITLYTVEAFLNADSIVIADDCIAFADDFIF